MTFFADRVKDTTTSGKTHEAFVEAAMGRDRDHPLPDGTLQAKFRDCAGQVLAEDVAMGLERGILSLDRGATIGGISSAIAGGVDARRPAA